MDNKIGQYSKKLSSRTPYSTPLLERGKQKACREGCVEGNSYSYEWKVARRVWRNLNWLKPSLPGLECDLSEGE